MRRFAAVILAAGFSSRMNDFKPLLEVGGMTAIERSVSAALEAGVGSIVVVTGHNRERLSSQLENLKASCEAKNCTLTEAYNEGFAQGMFSSIKKGLSYAKAHFADMKGAFLMPVDCPLITRGVLKALGDTVSEKAGIAAADMADSFMVPVFEGKKGHPLMIPASYIDEICSYDGPGGLKGITDKYWNKMVRVPVEEEGCVMDMDTPEGYLEITEFLKAGCRREPLQQLAAGKRISLVRHGETRQHDEKMFIGRYDVPLEEGAEKNVRAMAEKLYAQLGCGAEATDAGCSAAAPDRIYVSPLKRAVQTGEIFREVLGSDLCIIEDLQELSLGPWDGMPVREVKEKFPEEYLRRGEDMFAFKVGNKAENFYDVQYRAVKALRKILEADSSHDIVIVTHSTVIRALENNLKGKKVDDEWRPVPKNSYIMVDNL